MVTIKNIGKRVRMVADRILHPGESKPITAKQAEAFAGDAEFQIVALDPPPLPAASTQIEEHDLEGEKAVVVKKKRGRKK